MIRRWCVYLAVLTVSFGLYVEFPGWITWIAVLTVAGSPLVSVALSAARKEHDALGLFRFPGKRQVEYARQLRPYRWGDPLSRVHWKQKAKTGRLSVWEERAQEVPAPQMRRISGIVPVALCFAVLFCAFPPGSYDRQMHALQELFRRKPEVRFDLAAGPRTPSKQAVMDVVASESQMLYLRGQAFDVYNGGCWQSSNPDEWSVWEPEGTVRVAARSPKDMTLDSYNGVGEKPSKRCLQLPSQTKAWAAALVEGKTAEEIRNFVQNCAKYDENTGEMPENSDFVRWFVEESGRGYCVHFASAAAVLLRSAGIPARFVTGYAVQVQAGLRKTVVGDDAHAWVEYWDGSFWRILEATPTVEAATLPEMQKKTESNGPNAIFWALPCLAVFSLSLLFRRRRENARLRELRQKAAFSRDGLSEEEEREFADILAHLRKPKRERKGQKVKQDEKKPIPWEVADPKPPVVQSGKMENRKQN
ncbi:MAG: DUF58 domain-containing protein [Oscillospiraceae bacterium]|nr:DUF58 domain-containing protein [Oscillospiraceae bacterium]